jgi:hypothetical protein
LPPSIHGIVLLPVSWKVDWVSSRWKVKGGGGRLVGAQLRAPYGVAGLRTGSCYLADGIFADGIFRVSGDPVHAEDFTKNRPIDVDSPRNQADFDSSKLPFEIKSPNF